MNKIILIVFFCLFSCTFNETQKNKEKDKKEAEKITSLFFSKLKSGKEEDISKLFSDNFFKITPKDDLKKIIKTANSEAGIIRSYSLFGWESTVTTGGNAHSEYLLTYYVKRNKMNTLETFSMEKVGEEIKINGYDIKIDNQN